MATGKDKSSSHDGMQQHRIEEAESGEPLYSQECSILQSGDSLYSCLTDFGVKLHSLSKGDTVDVHIYEDSIEIEVLDDGA